MLAPLLGVHWLPVLIHEDGLNPQFSRRQELQHLDHVVVYLNWAFAGGCLWSRACPQIARLRDSYFLTLQIHISPLESRGFRRSHTGMEQGENPREVEKILLLPVLNDPVSLLGCERVGPFVLCLGPLAKGKQVF